MLINVHFLNGLGLIFNAQDFFELRTKYRIIGEFFGSTKVSQVALPIVISAEQLYILLKNGIINVVKYPKILNEPSSDDKVAHKNEVFKSYEEQKILLREERKTQIETYIDKIIEAKKGGEKTRDEVLQDELNKLPELQIDNMISCLFTEHPDYLKGVPEKISNEEVIKYTCELKRLVFEDLWSKNYYVTCGRKFGGDYLIYLGDPVLFHAICIVKCVNEKQNINASEFVAMGRLGHSVKKKYVLASLDSNKRVKYVTIDWFE